MEKDEITEILTSAAGQGLEIFQNYSTTRDLYPQCGTRPLFIGKRRKAYDDCVQNLINQSGTKQTPSTRDTLKKYFPYLLGGGILIVGLYYLKNKK